MKRKTLVNLLLSLGLVLSLGIGMVSSSNRVLAQDATVQGGISAQGVTGTAFTYQGRLTNASGPVSGACDFKFSLWDAASGGTNLYGEQGKTNVSLAHGNFSVRLDFGDDAFRGSARFLQIGVRCPAGSGYYTTLSGRVALTATPYAVSLIPGAIVQSNSHTGSAIVAIASSSSGDAAGLYGQASSPGGAGVSGWNLSSGYGVYGFSATGAGVYGRRDSVSGKAPPTGAGIWGDSASSPGVFGTSNSAGGVGGWSTSGPGVSGVSTSGNGIAGSSTSGYGVYGSSTANKAIYADGDAHVEGNLTWKAHTSYLSLPATVLQPQTDTTSADYNIGGYAYCRVGHCWFVAPVLLPHGATVTGIKTWWSDGSTTSNGLLRLLRVTPGSSSDMMADLETSGSAGNILVSSERNIVYADIDNSQYSYFLLVGLMEPSVITYYQTVIEYTTIGPN